MIQASPSMVDRIMPPGRRPYKTTGRPGQAAHHGAAGSDFLPIFGSGGATEAAVIVRIAAWKVPQGDASSYHA
jgi:hypothetical protein